MLIKPYRDGGPAIHAWDIAGPKIGVDVHGTINRPGDQDDGWSVELAVPWSVLREAAATRKPPQAGDYWRINFSRVQWQLDIADGRCVKRLRPGTKDPLPESNWAWSAQGAINMHMPERWVSSSFRASPQAPRCVVSIYRQREYRAANGHYATTLDALRAGDVRVEGLEFKPVLGATTSSDEITAPGLRKAVLHINHEGRVWDPQGR